MENPFPFQKLERGIKSELAIVKAGGCTRRLYPRPGRGLYRSP